MSLQQPDGDVHAQARFWGVEGGVLTLRMLRKKWDVEDFPVGTPLFCVFENVGRARTFRSVVLEAKQSPDTGALIALCIEAPGEILSEDRRKAFRVPAMGPTMVRAWLSHKEGAWDAEVRNMSVTGALITMEQHIVELLRADRRYRLNLSIGSHKANVVCVVKRKGRKGQVAVAFPRSVRMGEVHAPPEVSKVVRAMELLWLRKRSGAA